MIGAVVSGAATAWLAGVFQRVAERFMAARGWWSRAKSAPAAPVPWLAGSTHRWHTNPIFAATCDRVDAHSARVAILILQFLPNASAVLLRAAIVHDLGENAIGDVAEPVKRQNPDLYAKLEGLEGDALHAMGFDIPAHVLDAFEMTVLHLCDGLDAYLWAATHRPDHVAARADWRAMFARLRSRARELGFLTKFDEIVRGVCGVKF